MRKPNLRSLDIGLEGKFSKYLNSAEHVLDRLLKILSEKAPGIEAWLIEAFDTIFAPRLLLRHLLAAMALQAGLISYNMIKAGYIRFLSRLDRKHRDLKETAADMRLAQTYEEWKSAAERLDELEGHTEWRKRPDSLLYDHEMLQSQIDELNAMMHCEDVFGLMFRLRGSLSRSQHGMLHEGLFSRAHAGTKYLVESYHDTVCKALRYICTADGISLGIPYDAKLAFFNETRHSYGRTALMLSGGAAMGFYHIGVVKALIEQQLMPRVISGASAGSIVASMVGTRTDSELKPMYHGENINFNFFHPMRESKRRSIQPTNKLKHEAFWQFLVPPALRWAGEFFWEGLLSGEGLLRMNTEHFRSVVRHNVGMFTFQEAFDRTGRILNIIVAPRNRTDPPRLLNYLTAPHVLVWSAVVCSCGVPGVFEASTLLVKEADGSIRPEYSMPQKYVDGSMEADLPMQQISELFNINHFLVSQVNPHATLFSTMALSKSVWNHPLYSFLVGLVGFLKAQVRNWFRNVLEFVSLRRMAPVWATRRGGIQLLTQEYEGRDSDVTISPWEGHETLFSSFTKMLSNPSRREFARMVTVSERNTWPKIDMIRVHCAVEVTLEQCVRMARKQVIAEGQAQAAKLAAVAQYPVGKADSLKSVMSRAMRGGRVPSFYTSRSLVNMAGLGLASLEPVPSTQEAILPSHVQGIEEENDNMMDSSHNGNIGLNMESQMQMSLQRSDMRDTDGLYDTDESDDVGLQNVTEDDPKPKARNFFSDDEDDGVECNIVKSSSMSRFYYRRAADVGLSSMARNSTGALSVNTPSELNDSTSSSIMRSVTHSGPHLHDLIDSVKLKRRHTGNS